MKKRKNKERKEKHLKGNDIILNLKEISIGPLDSYSSSSFSGYTSFYIDCGTEHGYCEDPKFSGVIKILNIKKTKPGDTYLLKIKFKREQEEDY